MKMIFAKYILASQALFGDAEILIITILKIQGKGACQTSLKRALEIICVGVIKRNWQAAHLESMKISEFTDKLCVKGFFSKDLH